MSTRIGAQAADSFAMNRLLRSALAVTYGATASTMARMAQLHFQTGDTLGGTCYAVGALACALAGLAVRL